MGQLHIEKLDLSVLVQRSSIIVIAEPAIPPFITESVTIKENGKTFPAYERTIYRFRILENLHGYLFPGRIIEVVPANDTMNERMHRDYYTRGLGRHVMVHRYERVVSFSAEEPRIIFLKNSGSRYAYAVDGGEEGMSLRSKIDPREILVDQALLINGNFGVYGDLRAGLKVLRNTCEVTFADEPGGIRVDIAPRASDGKRGEGHEYRFLVTPEGNIDELNVAE